MVYLLKMVIFHGYVSHNQMVYWMVQSPLLVNFPDFFPCHASQLQESEEGDDSWLGIRGCLETDPEIDMCEVFWGKQRFRVQFQFELNGILEILEPKSQGSNAMCRNWVPTKVAIGSKNSWVAHRKPRIPPPCVAGAPGWNCVDVAGDVTGMMLNIHISIYAYIILYTYWYIYICEDVWRYVNIARIGVTIHGAILLLGAFWWISARSLTIICNLHFQQMANQVGIFKVLPAPQIPSPCNSRKWCSVRWWDDGYRLSILKVYPTSKWPNWDISRKVAPAGLPWVVLYARHCLSFVRRSSICSQIVVFGICPVFLRQPTTAEGTIASIFRALPPPMWAVGLHLIPKSFTSSTSPTFHLGLPFLFPSSYVGMTRYDCKVMVILYLQFFAAPSSDASKFIHVYPIIRHSPGSP